MTCDWTTQCHASFSVIGRWRKYNGRSPTALLVTNLRAKHHPNDISALRNIPAATYHTSLPTAGPHISSLWMFSSVILDTNSSNLYFCFFMGAIISLDRK